MGLGGSGGSSSGAKTFSDDFLKIEICGPQQQHLNVFDIPGIFKNTSEGVTTKSDIPSVRNMVGGYMKNPRSVIFTVIPPNVDVAMQEILEMAKKCDPKGQRTLEVLTKPDLVNKGAGHRVIGLIKGESLPNGTLCLSTIVLS